VVTERARSVTIGATLCRSCALAVRNLTPNFCKKHAEGLT
jgi:hypothetical protein